MITKYLYNYKLYLTNNWNTELYVIILLFSYLINLYDNALL